VAGSGLFISYLGALAVHVDGRALALPRGVTTRLLVLLALHPGQVVRDSILIDSLWEDDRAPRSMGALRNAAMRLRDALGGAASAVTRAGDGYRLDGAGYDTVEFERLVETGRGMDDVAESRATIERALDLVRGPPLDEWSDERWARRAIDLWTERIASAEDLLGTLTARRPSADDVAALRSHADQRPEREVRWVNLVRTLAGVGRRADALRAYRHAVRALGEIGLTPGPELRLAEAEILAADTMLAHSDSAAPGCVGRDELVAEVVALLQSHRAINLVGLGGVGKTRLAIEVATAFCDTYGDRLVEVDLTDVTDRTSLLVALGDSAGLTLGAHTGMGALDALDAFAAATASRAMLLVLDNAEHVADPVRELVGAVLARCSTVRVLLTAREPLEFPGENSVVVPPLPTPAPSLDAAESAANASVRLLSAIRRPATTDPLVAARIARAVGGLPLGLELAAGLSRHVPLGDVADGLEAEFVALDLHHPGLRPRQRLDAVFRYAIARLSDEDRSALGSLSVLGAPLTTATATALIAGESPGSVTSTPVASLSRLVGATLLDAEPGIVPTYRLLPLQRAAAFGILDRGERRAAEERAERWYLALAAELGPQLRSPGQRQALAVLRAELRNIRATVVRLLQRQQATLALRLIGDLGDFWGLTLQQAECARLTTMGLDASEAGEGSVTDAERARALFTVAAASTTFRELQAHQAAARSAFDLASAAGDRRLRLHTAVLVATIEGWSGRGDRATELLAEVLAGDDEYAITHALDLLGLGALAAGHHADGLRRFAEVAQRWQAAGDRFNEARSAMRSGSLLVRHGLLDEAEAALRRAIDLAGHELPNVEIHARQGLAAIGLERGDDGAAEALTRLADRFVLAGDLGCACTCHRTLAEVARTAGDDEEALRLLRQNLSLLGRINAQDAALSLVQIAEIYRGQGAPADAANQAAAARLMSSGSGPGWTNAQWDRLAALESATATAEPAGAVDVGDAVRLALRR
jgi:predicted ATPase/DNA-binding SARP family transcriptional activator